VIDEDAIVEQVADVAAACRVKVLYLDPWNARRVGPAFLARGVPAEQSRQGYASLNEPTKILDDLVTAGKIRHRGNRILRWHARNCVALLDPANNVKFDKGKRRRKIDGIAALVSAVAAALGKGREEPVNARCDGSVLRGQHRRKRQFPRRGIYA
jgi:phage terminase large subunit-like protein